MVLYRKAVSLVLKSGDHIESLGSGRKFNLLVIVVKSPCSVVVILYHAAHRNVQTEISENLKSDVNLSSASVHHEDIWVDVELFISESSGENFPHAGVVIWSIYGAKLEFSVVIFLSTAIFKYYHGSD